jgi:hypothetical protein
MATTIRVVNPRNINGAYTSPSFRLPNKIKLPIKFLVELTDAQFANAAKTLDFRVEVSPDNLVWRSLCSFTWVGGPKEFKGQPDYNRPGVVLTDYPSLSDKYVRIKAITTSILNIGLRIEHE